VLSDPSGGHHAGDLLASDLCDPEIPIGAEDDRIWHRRGGPQRKPDEIEALYVEVILGRVPGDLRTRSDSRWGHTKDLGSNPNCPDVACLTVIDRIRRGRCQVLAALSLRRDGVSMGSEASIG
jgi:hypothetical protein